MTAGPMRPADDCERLVEAATRLADWYRNGGSPNTPQYGHLVTRLVREVDIYRNTQQKATP